MTQVLVFINWLLGKGTKWFGSLSKSTLEKSSIWKKWSPVDDSVSRAISNV